MATVGTCAYCGSIANRTCRLCGKAVCQEHVTSMGMDVCQPCGQGQQM